MKKVLFFTAGPKATTQEETAYQALKTANDANLANMAHIELRNASVPAVPTVSREQTDYIAGSPPAAFNGVPTWSGSGVAPGIVANTSATIFGGSHAAYGQPYIAGSAPTGGGGTSMSDIAFANDIIRQTGVGLDLINLRAEGGTTVFQQESNQLPSVLTDPGDGAVYPLSTNAFNDTTSAPLNGGVPYTLTQIINANIRIINSLAANKKWAVIFALPPVDQAGSTGAKPRASEFPALNAACKAACAAKSNVLWIDVYEKFVDPASVALNPKVNLIQTADGIHRTTFGARQIGEAYAAQLAAFLAGFKKYRTVGPNLLKPWTGGGGTVTPGAGGAVINGVANVPAGYDVNIGAGTPTVDITKLVNGSTRFTITNAGTAAVVQINATNTAELLAAMTTGDAIQGGFTFEQIGTATGLTRIATSMRLNGSTLGTSWRSMFRDTTNEPDAVFKMDQRAISARRLWNPWRLPSAPTAVDYFIQIGLAAGGSVTIDISSTEMNKLTA